MNMMKWVGVAVLGVVAACGQARAGTIIIDQQNLTGTNPAGAGTIGQSFTPTQSAIDAAFFQLATFGGRTSNLIVDVFQGSGFGGTLLGSSNIVTYASVSYQNVEFDFASSIALTAGNVYTLRISSVSGANAAAEYAVTNPYSGGVGFNATGFGVSSVDLRFQEGVAAAVAETPEPATLGMAATAAAAGLIAYRRRKRVTA